MAFEINLVLGQARLTGSTVFYYNSNVQDIFIYHPYTFVIFILCHPALRHHHSLPSSIICRCRSLFIAVVCHLSLLSIAIVVRHVWLWSGGGGGWWR